MRGVVRIRWAVMAVALVATLGISRAQVIMRSPNNAASDATRDPSDLGTGFGGGPYLNRDLLERQLKRLRELHQQELMTDTERLLKLATSLKEEVDKGNSTLNTDVMKDADEISKLAKRVSDRIKTQ